MKPNLLDEQIRACDERIKAKKNVARQAASAAGYQPADFDHDATPAPSSAKSIIKQLTNALAWIQTASLRRDKLILEELVAGCIKVLQQSPTNYNAWAKRHAAAIRRFDKSALVKLVNLTISDVEASPLDYAPVWQLDQFAGTAKLAKAAKLAKLCVCEQCKRKFYPDRKAKFCSQACQNRASYLRRKFMAKTA